jgi:hypothetical protein
MKAPCGELYKNKQNTLTKVEMIILYVIVFPYVQTAHHLYKIPLLPIMFIVPKITFSGN